MKTVHTYDAVNCGNLTFVVDSSNKGNRAGRGLLFSLTNVGLMHNFF